MSVDCDAEDEGCEPGGAAESVASSSVASSDEESSSSDPDESSSDSPDESPIRRSLEQRQTAAKRRELQRAAVTELRNKVLHWEHTDGQLRCCPPEPGRPVPSRFSQASEYCEVLRPLLLCEIAESEEARRGRLSLSGRLSKKGYKQGGITFARLDVEEATAELKSNDLLRIHNPEGVYALGLLHSRNAGSIELVLNLRLSSPGHIKRFVKAFSEGSYWQLDRITNLSTSFREYAALEAFRQRESSLRHTVLSGAGAHYGAVSQNVAAELDGSCLNELQRKAVTQAATLERGFMLLQGPPGTGKTRTICEIIRHRLSPARSGPLLVCAPSNGAVDEVVSRLLRSGGQGRELRVVRVGSIESLDPLVLECHIDQVVARDFGPKSDHKSGRILAGQTRLRELSEMIGEAHERRRALPDAELQANADYERSAEYVEATHELSVRGLLAGRQGRARRCTRRRTWSSASSRV